MATKYTQHHQAKLTPQDEPIPYSNQVPNKAGGFGFKLDSWARMTRFIVLGSEGGTFYAGAKELTKENTDNVVACIKQDGVKAVNLITEISTSTRAPKNDPAIFALALVKAYGNDEAKKALYEAIPKVCRTGTHLFQFCQSVNDIASWSRGLKNSVKRYYTAMPEDKLELHLVKYRQRDGWTHRDVLRLTHPKGVEGRRNLLLKYAVGKAGASDVGGMIEAYEKLKTASVPEAIKLIEQYKLPWEALPTEMTTDKRIWYPLLPHMGYTALMRNLAKMTSLGVLVSNLDDTTKLIAEKLSHPEKERVHPMAILLALKTYASGHGFKGNLTWSPVHKLSDVLNEAFYAAFKNVEPTGKNLCLGVDVSGSMFGCGANIAGSHLTAGEAAAAMCLVTANVEPHYEIKAYSHQLVDLDISPKMRLDQVMKKMQSIPMGGTDCSLPIKWAHAMNTKVDAFVSYTDNETWYNGSPWSGRGRYSNEYDAGHPVQWLKKYQSLMGINAKLIEVGFTATSTSIADVSDPNMLSMVGFDASAPAMMSEFIRGNI